MCLRSAIAQNSLNQEELFLTNGFKLIFSQSLVKIITDWFTNKFMVIYHADSLQLIKRFADPQKKTIYVEKTTDKAAKLFCINSNTLGYVVEDDASIHPMALMSIINIFHNDDINIHHAQLIFNTHNPIFLNANLFRRDEIKFVERVEDTHYSTLYALSDFGTTRENGVRKHEDYMKNYFVSQYGAIKNIDFTQIFEDLLANEDEV